MFVYKAVNARMNLTRTYMLLEKFGIPGKKKTRLMTSL